jgi:hypothetical protein
VTIGAAARDWLGAGAMFVSPTSGKDTIDVVLGALSDDYVHFAEGEVRR